MNASFPTRHILFDLGGTLMHARNDWRSVLARADQALAATLHAHQIELDTQVFRAHLHQYYEKRDKDYEETTYHFVLRELLRELGYAEVPESVLRSALDALYSVTQKNWAIEDDAAAALQQLVSQNCHLGIFSNAGDDQDVQELVESFGVRPYFDFVLTSAACYYRKPHPRAFEMALAQWNITAEESIMVGDSLQADIEGAKKLGMKAIWITRRAQFTLEEKTRIHPDLEISSLGELPPLLKQVKLR
jgi:putative hydrolase of the HAD superfamily